MNIRAVSKKIRKVPKRNNAYYIIFGDEFNRYKLVVSEDSPNRYLFELRNKRQEGKAYPYDRFIIKYDESQTDNVKDLFRRGIERFQGNIGQLIESAGRGVTLNYSAREYYKALEKLNELACDFGSWQLADNVTEASVSSSIKDTRKSTVFSMGFTFKHEVTKEEALQNIQELLDENDGKIPIEWLRIDSE